MGTQAVPLPKEAARRDKDLREGRIPDDGAGSLDSAENVSPAQQETTKKN